MNKRSLIHQNVAHFNEVIECQKNRHKLSHQNIELMAVTKMADSEDILDAFHAGIRLFGENYIQQAISKLDALYLQSGMNSSLFHFIGHLQSNKIQKVLSYFSCIDAIDTYELAEKINQKAAVLGLVFPCFVEINTAMETSKYGFYPEKILLFMDKIVCLENVKVVGLMTMGPLDGNELNCRRAFARLRSIKEQIATKFGLGTLRLSMGMSNDFVWAIQEGSNILRIGRGIFGEESIQHG